MSAHINSIDPLKHADKHDAARNLQLPKVLCELKNEPRLVEALWFLSWVSMPETYMGGLGKFAADFVEKYQHEIGPESLRLQLAIPQIFNPRHQFNPMKVFAERRFAA